MARTTRTVEMYLGKSWSSVAGGDSGEWWTTEVEIPVKTPEAKIEKVATEKLWSEINTDELGDIVFAGVYYVPSLEELDEQDAEDAEFEEDEANS
jgi:hypothetical protein